MQFTVHEEVFPSMGIRMTKIIGMFLILALTSNILFVSTARCCQKNIFNTNRANHKIATRPIAFDKPIANDDFEALYRVDKLHARRLTTHFPVTIKPVSTNLISSCVRIVPISIFRPYSIATSNIFIPPKAL